jgi:hypothetical protein
VVVILWMGNPIQRTEFKDCMEARGWTLDA